MKKSSSIRALAGMLFAMTLAVAAPVGAATASTVTTAGPSTAAAAAAARGSNPGSYTNPLAPVIPGDGVVESCADPNVIQGQREGDTTWYLYCTTDPLNDEDVDAEGNPIFHRVPTMTSENLVDWTYVGDAFTSLPSWAEPDAALWA